jgi:hypothetical protein
MVKMWLRALRRVKTRTIPNSTSGIPAANALPAGSRLFRWGLSAIAASVALGCAWLLLLQLRASDSDTETKKDKGIAYRNDRVSSVPWSVHIVTVDRKDPTLEIHSMMGRGSFVGLNPISEQVLSLPAGLGTPLAGVNGDFYQREGSSYPGDPRGLQIVEGELVSAPTGGTAFWTDAEGNPHVAIVTSQFKVTWPDGQSYSFGLNEERQSGKFVLFTPALGRKTGTRDGREFLLERAADGPWLPLRAGQTYTAKVREVKDSGNNRIEADTVILSAGRLLVSNLPPTPAGTVLKISTAMTPDLSGAKTAIGGGSIVTQDGRKTKIERAGLSRFVDSYSQRSAFERHPRSAIGWNKTHFYLIEVDGRQRGLSVGMTLEELGEYMAKLGCEEAMSLDGGGSATFWYRGRIMNSPCDGTERPVANGLVVVRKNSPPSR